MILFEKYGQHQPLNRQAERYARDCVDLSLSTLADQVGGCAMVLQPLYDLIRAHVFAGSRVHGDDSVLQQHTERMICCCRLIDSTLKGDSRGLAKQISLSAMSRG
jgi:hypothetical protein